MGPRSLPTFLLTFLHSLFALNLILNAGLMDLVGVILLVVIGTVVLVVVMLVMLVLNFLFLSCILCTLYKLLLYLKKLQLSCY